MKEAISTSAEDGFASYCRLRYTFGQYDKDESGALDKDELVAVLKDYQKKHLKRARNTKVMLKEASQYNIMNARKKKKKKKT